MSAPALQERVLTRRAVLAAAAVLRGGRRRRGPHLVVEVRIYRYEAHALPELLTRWGDKIERRTSHSPLIFCGHMAEEGVLEWHQVWGYADLKQRQEVRAEVVRQGIWPPGVFTGLLSQENMALIKV